MKFCEYLCVHLFFEGFQTIHCFVIPYQLCELLMWKYQWCHIMQNFEIFVVITFEELCFFFNFSFFRMSTNIVAS